MPPWPEPTSKDKVANGGSCVPRVPLAGAPQRFTPGSRIDPTKGMGKAVAADDFRRWLANLPPTDWGVCTDGSQKKLELGYGFAVFRAGKDVPMDTGRASINSCSVVLDAKALGALQGLQRILEYAAPTERVWVCLDNTAAIWCLGGTASKTSQQHLLTFHKGAENHPGAVRVKWSPGHMNIDGNEYADALAKAGLTTLPTLAGVKMALRNSSGGSGRMTGGRQTEGCLSVTSPDVRHRSCFWIRRRPGVLGGRRDLLPRGDAGPESLFRLCRVMSDGSM